MSALVSTYHMSCRNSIREQRKAANTNNQRINNNNMGYFTTKVALIYQFDGTIELLPNKKNHMIHNFQCWLQ